MSYDVSINGKSYRLELNRADGRWSCRLDRGENNGRENNSRKNDDREIELDAVLIRPDVLSLRIGNQAYEVKSERIGTEQYLWIGGARFAAEVHDPRSLRNRVHTADDQGPRKLTAPMPGRVVRVLLAAGTIVESGAGVLVVEAMKMQNEIKSPKKGTIQKIMVSAGTAVNAGDVLAIIE